MTRKNDFIRICVTILLSIFIFTFASSQERIGKELNETVDLSPQTKLFIENKYGNIDIRNWDKKTIDVSVKVILYDIDDKEAEELLKMINIDYKKEGDNLFFETKYDESFSNSLTRINNRDKKFEVNYIVNMPHHVPVNLKNRYGNIFVGHISSVSTIEINYGKFKANNISSSGKEPMTKIVLGYSDGSIEKSNWMKVIMKYSKLNIDESKALIVQSKYSKVFLERGSSLVVESKYDTYEIGVLANFVAEAAYCNYKFKSIGKKLQLETKYTDVKIGYVPASFEQIKITNSYGSYKIGIEDGASYHLKGASKYGNIIYPENSKVNRFQKPTALNVNGIVGKQPQTKSRVIIETKYGTVKLTK